MIGIEELPGDLDQLVFDPGGPDELTMQLSVLGSQFALFGQIDGAINDWTFTKLNVESPGETGSWWAISIECGGVDLTQNGAVNKLMLTSGSSYSVNAAVSQERLLCSANDVLSNCSALGTYTASYDSFQFIDGVEGSPLDLSLDITPTTLRLCGTMGGSAADILYVRVPGSM